MKQKVILDTDIGSDIDDAVCLAYLLAEPECDLLGITTVSGESVKRAQMADALCRAAGREIPIYPGAEKPLLVKQAQPQAHQAEVLSHSMANKTYPQGYYLTFLRDTIRQHPGEITLLAIGPLTNIALLFRMDPELPSLLKSLVLMCGRFTGRPLLFHDREWNALLDPHATAIVYREAIQTHRSFGLDVTTHVQMEAQEVRERFQGPVLSLVRAFAEVWFRSRPTITFHDPLAGACLFQPDICTYQRGTVQVETNSETLGGHTLWRSGEDGPHEIAITVQPDRFFEHFFDRVSG